MQDIETSLASIEKKLAVLTERVDLVMSSLQQLVDDHEGRIRALERTRYSVAGAAAVVASFGALMLQWIVRRVLEK